MHYIAKVTQEGGRWLAEFPGAPGCQTFAETEQALPSEAAEALAGWLAAWLDTGGAPPEAKRQPREGLRVNVEPALAVAIEFRRARLGAGLTQAQAAKLAGVSQQQIAKLEKPGQNPGLATLVKVGAALGVRPVVTFERVEP